MSISLAGGLTRESRHFVVSVSLTMSISLAGGWCGPRGRGGAQGRPQRQANARIPRLASAHGNDAGKGV